MRRLDCIADGVPAGLDSDGRATTTRGSGSHVSVANTSGNRSHVARRLSAHAQYAAFARAVNLRYEDLPGFSVAPNKKHHVSPHNKALENGAVFRRCFRGFTEAKPVFRRHSTKFKAGTSLHLVEVSSEVEMGRSVAHARSELARAKRALGSAATQHCLASSFDALGTQGAPLHVGRATVHITVGDLHLVLIPMSSVTKDTDGAAGLTMTFTVDYRASIRGRVFTRAVPFQLDSFTYLIGRADVTLSVITFGTSFPPEMEARLFSALVSRGLTAAHGYPSISSQ